MNRLSINDIDGFVCGIGPGSFTGIRISVGAAKTFGAFLCKPIIAVSALEALAFSLRGLEPSRILCLINAYKNMVYYGFFESSCSGVRELQPAGAIHVQDLHHAIDLSKNFWIVGDGFSTYKDFLPKKLMEKAKRPCEESLSETFDRPLVENTLRLGLRKAKNNEAKDWSLIVPLYIRNSEAEEHKQGLKIKPLT
jgi:tRNA threonylcarbamoyl adenosine modification protein YeaZ